MDPLSVGLMASGAASLIGGLVGTKYTADRAAGGQEWALQQSERLSSTAYQRATADLRAAGLNPMLAYMHGGASSPQAVGPQVPDFGRVAGETASNAAAISGRMLEARRVQAEIGMMNAQKAKALAESLHTMEDMSNLSSSRALADAQRKLAEMTTRMSSFELEGRRKAGIIHGQNWFQALRGSMEALRGLPYNPPSWHISR